jgi:hypothetical protein
VKSIRVWLPGPEGMAFMLVWLRLSTNRQLDWYRNSSHQSKDIAHVQKTLAQRMADKVPHPTPGFANVFMCAALGCPGNATLEGSGHEKGVILLIWLLLISHKHSGGEIVGFQRFLEWWCL